MHGRPLTLETLNALAPADFAAALDGIFEHAPWVAERTAGRPFLDVPALHAALMTTVRAATGPERAAFLNAHPELAADKLPPGLTDSSATEQSGLAMRDAAGSTELPALNQAYRARFGIPFIVCVARHTGENVLRTLRARLERDPAVEHATALDEVAHITRLRLYARLGLPAPSGHLGLHALDLDTGRPASNLAVALRAEGRHVAQVTTDADGRVTSGLLPPGPIRQGRYELLFDAGAYFAERRIDTFYDTIPIRFVVGQAEARYHVPLLLAPFGYSTYRGS